MATILFRTISSIFYIGGLVMTAVGGWYDYQQTLTIPYGPFGLSILLWGIIIAGLGSLLLISQMWYRIWKLENPKVEIDVYPNSLVARDITLVVHNRSKIPADFSATMTPKFDYAEANISDSKIQGLIDVSMVWEASGTASDKINPDGRKIIKICSVDEQILTEKTKHYIRFYKVESSQLQSFECASYMDGDAIPKVNIDVQVNSDMPIKGQRNWVYEIGYINDGRMLTISLTHKSRRTNKKASKDTIKGTESLGF